MKLLISSLVISIFGDTLIDGRVKCYIWLPPSFPLMHSVAVLSGILKDPWKLVMQMNRWFVHAVDHSPKILFFTAQLQNDTEMIDLNNPSSQFYLEKPSQRHPLLSHLSCHHHPSFYFEPPSSLFWSTARVSLLLFSTLPSLYMTSELSF